MTAQPQKHGAEGIPLLTDVPGGALPNASPDPKFATVGAVYDRPYFVESRKNGRS